MKNKLGIVFWGLCIVIWVYAVSCAFFYGVNEGTIILIVFNVFFSVYCLIRKNSDSGFRKISLGITRVILAIFILFFIIGEGMILNGLIRNNDNKSDNFVIMLQNEKNDVKTIRTFINELHGELDNNQRVVVFYDNLENLRKILDKMKFHRNRESVKFEGSPLDVLKELKSNGQSYFVDDIDAIKVVARVQESFRLKMIGREVGIDTYVQGIKGNVLTIPMDHVQEMFLITKTIVEELLPYMQYR